MIKRDCHVFRCLQLVNCTIGENQYNTEHINGTGNNDERKNKFGPQSKNLASIIRGFKISITKNARKFNPGFAWKSRCYDHIIRNTEAYNCIANYIANNPIYWQDDIRMV